MAEKAVQVSARNRLAGRITAIKTDGIMAQVDLQVGANQVVAVITAEAVAELGLQVGMAAAALIKSTSVMIVTGDTQVGGL